MCRLRQLFTKYKMTQKLKTIGRRHMVFDNEQTQYCIVSYKRPINENLFVPDITLNICTKRPSKHLNYDFLFHSVKIVDLSMEYTNNKYKLEKC